MEKNTVCISIKRHLELLDFEKKLMAPKQHKTRMNMSRHYSHGAYDEVVVETDDECVKIMADELKKACEEVISLLSERDALRERLYEKSEEMSKLEEEVSNFGKAQKKWFWSKIF